MNQEQVNGNWMQLKGKVQEQWGKLTDNDLTIAQGQIEMLAGRVQERYGVAKEDVQRQVDEFMKKHASQ